MAKVGRKENGQGTIRRLANGKIQCSIETQDADGKRKIITATATKETEARKKAQSKLKQYKVLLMNGKEEEKGLATKTLKEVMGGKWFDNYSKNRWTSRTKNARKDDLGILYKALGSIRLDKITTSMMNDFFINALTPTNRQRLGMVYSIANDFFDDMYNDGIIEIDVFGRGMKKLPSPRKVVKEEYTLEEIEQVDFDGDIKHLIFKREKNTNAQQQPSIIDFCTQLHFDALKKLREVDSYSNEFKKLSSYVDALELQFEYLFNVVYDKNKCRFVLKQEKNG